MNVMLGIYIGLASLVCVVTLVFLVKDIFFAGNGTNEKKEDTAPKP